jgi:glutamine synthetase
MLMAGLDGIKNKIDPGKPLDVDIFELSAEEAKHVPSMPGSLDQSLSNLEKDHDYLTQGGVFSKDLIETWIGYKRKNEADPVRMRPHPYEFHLYYDI